MPGSNLTSIAFATQETSVPQYTYKLDVDALEFDVSSDTLEIKENSKKISKGKERKEIGKADYNKQRKKIDKVLEENNGLEEQIEEIMQTTEDYKPIAISVKEVYFKTDEESNTKEVITKEEYERNKDGNNENGNTEDESGGILKKVVKLFEPKTVHAADVGTSPSNYLYENLRLITTVSVDLSKGSSRVFWAQSNAYWSSQPSKWSAQSKDLISIACDTTSWKPTNNAISTVTYLSNNSWVKPTLSQANGNALMWAFPFKVSGYSNDYVNGVYAGANYAYGNDGYATFYSNYVHSYASVNLSAGLSTTTGSITVSNTTKYDSVANYVTCYLTTYYAA